MNKKPLRIKGYGSIPHLSNSRLGPSDKRCSPGHERIVTEKLRDYKDLIIVQEKLDGANCSIAKINGKLFALTRSGYLAKDSQYKQHHLFYRYVNKHYSEFDSIIHEGERLVGEWLIQACGTHYSLQYNELFAPFDIMIRHQRATYLEVLQRVSKTGLVMPKLLHIGGPVRVKNLLPKLKHQEERIAIDRREGLVYRCERDGEFDFIVKYVVSGKKDGVYLDREIYNHTIENL